MSVQSEFFDSLLAELKARGLSDEVAEENVSKFRSQLIERAEDDSYIDSALSKIPPASIAETIYNMILAETDENAGTKSEFMVIDTENDTVETVIKEGKDAVSEPSEEPEESEKSEENADPSGMDAATDACDDEENAGVDPVVQGGSAEPVTDTEDDSDKSEEPSDNSPEENTENSADGDIFDNDDGRFFSDDFFVTSSDSAESETDSESDVTSESASDAENVNAEEETAKEEANSEEGGDDTDDFSAYSPLQKRRVHEANVHSAAQTPPGERKTVKRTQEAIDLFSEEEEGKEGWLFIVMAVFLVPLFFVLGAVAFVAVLGLWAAIAVIIALLLVALAAIVCIGTIYALMGLIFGVIEAFSGNAAAALFETGLALLVGGVIMFLGILVYNFAIRFLPFIIKKLGVLLVFIFKLFKKAFFKIRDLCRKI